MSEPGLAPIDAETLRASYAEDGFVLGIDVMDEAEAAIWRQELLDLEAAELARRGGRWPDRDHRPWEQDDHPLRDWARRLASHPRLVQAVSALIGDRVLVRNADVFDKPVGWGEDIAWHVDSRETGPDLDGMVTAWLALTPGRRHTGAVEYSRGSHRMDLSHGASTRHQLTLDRRAMSRLDPRDLVRPTTRPGQANLHQFRTAHRSGPNRSDSRRLAFVVRYVTPDVDPQTAESGRAMPVLGEDLGRFAPLAYPAISWTGPT